MRSAVLRRHGLKEELRPAVEREELVVHYQPIVELTAGDVVATEALVRWKQPGGGSSRPASSCPLPRRRG